MEVVEVDEVKEQDYLMFMYFGRVEGKERSCSYMELPGAFEEFQRVWVCIGEGLLGAVVVGRALSRAVCWCVYGVFGILRSIGGGLVFRRRVLVWLVPGFAQC